MKRLLLPVLTGLGLFCSCAEPQPVQKPNVIVLFIDDMGWGDFSCFGNTDAQTPNIDRMAEQGISFEQFYVNSPICSPWRVAIREGEQIGELT